MLCVDGGVGVLAEHDSGSCRSETEAEETGMWTILSAAVRNDELLGREEV